MLIDVCFVMHVIQELQGEQCCALTLTVTITLTVTVTLTHQIKQFKTAHARSIDKKTNYASG